ncbi:MAG TPA: ubiquinone biosynthesis regulatory protein kinase UbiB, partial [Coxiellaceae bacterium]|nr:ubiquinone biosynthesis regulatory protein kinase UbiB [Coxiellaceae bacterium]
LRLFQTAERFDMEVQPQLLLLQKTLLNIEGLGRELYPDLDLWETGKPFLEKWMRKQHGFSSILRRILKALPINSEKLAQLPELAYNVLTEIHQQQLKKRSDEHFNPKA